MTVTGTRTSYGVVAQGFHWLTVLLVGAAFLLSAGGPESRVYDVSRADSLLLHETLGMLVLVVLVLRLAWRAVDRAPQEPEMPGWMALSSRLVHWLLYALLVAVPVTAVIGAWYEGHAVTVYGLGAIGPWVTASPTLGQLISRLHPLLGDAIMWVAGLHAAAALFHHFLMKDRVLLSMLPGTRA